MGDADNNLPPSKKRAAGRELSRDNPGLDDEEDTSQQETGTFKKASEEVLATRRMVKVRRQQSSAAPSSNPFAGICLVPPSVASGTTANATAAAAEKKEDSNDNTIAEKKTADDKDKMDNLPEIRTEVTVAESGIDKEKNENSYQTSEQEMENDKAGNSKIGNKDKEGRSSDANKTEVDKSENEKTLQDSKIVSESKDDKSEVSKPVIADENCIGNDEPQNDERKDNATEGAGQSAEGASLRAFGSLSSTQNAFTGLTGTGFSSSTFSFGTIPKDGSSCSATSGSLFGQNTGESSPFSFSLPSNGSSSLFGSAAASILAKSEGSSFPSMKEVPVETGEESEQVVFAADSALFEFLDGTWKERGKGELKVNVTATEIEKARILMRAKGNYRLILNASLYPDMKLTNMDKKGITFACVNSVSDGKTGLSTFAAKFRDSSIVEEFRAAVMEYKGKVTTTLKTPENSS